MRFRSPLLTQSRLFSLPRPTQMFQFGRFPPKLQQPRQVGTFQIQVLKMSRFPYSDTNGSKLRGSSPLSFVTMYVLLRQVVPRHPLSALVKTYCPEPGRFRTAFLFRCQRTKLLISVLWIVDSAIHHSPLTKHQVGGPGRGRTAYLVIANDAFSQLNFGPAS